MALSKVTQISGFSCVEDISRTARYYCVRFKDRCIKENFTPIEYIQKQWINNKNVSLIETALHLYNCFIIDTYPIDVLKANSEELSDCFMVLIHQLMN